MGQILVVSQQDRRTTIGCDEEVEITVVIDIEEGRPGPRGLGQKLFTRRAGVVTADRPRTRRFRARLRSTLVFIGLVMPDQDTESPISRGRRLVNVRPGTVVERHGPQADFIGTRTGLELGT